MSWLLLLSAALAAELVIDAKVPAEIYVSGNLIGQLAVPGTLTIEVVPGEQRLKVYTEGRPHELTLQVDPVRGSRVIVGRTGLTADAAPPTSVASDLPRVVEFRSVADEEILVVMDDGRHRIAAGDRLELTLPPGDHRLSVRGGNGTVVFAVGTLRVGDAALVVQLAEGRMPEVAGAGGAFRPDSR